MNPLKFVGYYNLNDEIFLNLKREDTDQQFEITIPEFLENFNQLLSLMHAADGFRIGYFACEYAMRK